MREGGLDSNFAVSVDCDFSLWGQVLEDAHKAGQDDLLDLVEANPLDFAQFTFDRYNGRVVIVLWPTARLLEMIYGS